MTEHRLPCRTEGCANTIQPATAKRNEGYCGPCFGRITHAKRKAFIAANRKDVDPYAGVTDPVEMLTILHQPRKHDPLIHYLPCPKSDEELYAVLTPEQATQMMGIATQEFADPDFDEGEDQVCEDIARCLAAFTDHDLDPMLSQMIASGRCYPPIAFRNAGDEIAAALLRSLPGDRLALSHALLCLAWIGSDEVVAFFDEADRNRPAWAEQLYVSPGRYAHDAGWEVRDGRRHDLYYRECFAIEVLPEGASGEACIETMRETATACDWCARGLVDLLRLDLTDPRFAFLPQIDRQLRVSTCPVCTCFTDGGPFMKRSGPGDWEWVGENQRPEYLPPADQEWDTSPWATAQLRFRPRPPHHAADGFLPTTYSQVGGLPTWVQDPQYPACITCNRTMSFIAQLDNGDFRYSEGTYYAFICPGCSVTATAYQQT